MFSFITNVSSGDLTLAIASHGIKLNFIPSLIITKDSITDSVALIRFVSVLCSDAVI